MTHWCEVLGYVSLLKPNLKLQNYDLKWFNARSRLFVSSYKISRFGITFSELIKRELICRQFRIVNNLNEEKKLLLESIILRLQFEWASYQREASAQIQPCVEFELLSEGRFLRLPTSFWHWNYEKKICEPLLKKWWKYKIQTDQEMQQFIAQTVSHLHEYCTFIR